MSTSRNITPTSIVRAAPGQVSSRLGDEVVILGLDNNRYFGLDAVGASVWNLLKEPTSVAAIRDELLKEFEIDAEVCERDLVDLLHQLAEHQLIEITNEASA